MRRSRAELCPKLWLCIPQSDYNFKLFKKINVDSLQHAQLLILCKCLNSLWGEHKVLETVNLFNELEIL